MNTELSDAKRFVHDFSTAIRGATSETIADVLTPYYVENATWHGPKPLDDLEGLSSIIGGYWRPLLESFPDLQKNDRLLFGGTFEDEVWVCAAGSLVGTFEHDWLDIPATGHPTWIRYGEFHRVEEGGIAETLVLFDVLDVLQQAGYEFVPALAPEVVTPGPTTRDGIQLGEHDDTESQKTMELVDSMVEGLHSFEEKGFEQMGMEKYWHKDFMWYGPAGIGTTRGINGFRAYHQHPFLEAFPDRQGGQPDANVAEGDYCAWAAIPAMTGTHTGSGWLGLPATDTQFTMRVMDVWRREGDKLAENWVYIDIVDFLQQIGIDVFERLEKYPESVRI
jgi:predicted ester cyclase